jgi:hypothetical protein
MNNPERIPMMNPYQKPDDPLKKRAHLYLQNSGVPMQIKTLVKDTFTAFLQNDPVVLTRNEKRRLYRSIIGEMFEEIMTDL